MTAMKDTVAGRRRPGAPKKKPGEKKADRITILFSEKDLKELARIHGCKADRVKAVIKKVAENAIWKRNT
jgi:hypothetical protein